VAATILVYGFPVIFDIKLPWNVSQANLNTFQYW